MASSATKSTNILKSVDFEVFGKVQGVFFRKNTVIQAKQQGLVGWVRNTSQNTVVGVIQGPDDKIGVVKNWLKYVGSRKSRIDDCHFKNERTIEKAEYSSFAVRH